MRPPPAATTNIPPPPSIPPSFSWARNNRPLLPFFYLRCPPPPPPSSGLVRPSSVRGDPSLEERCPQGENGGGREGPLLPTCKLPPPTNERVQHSQQRGWMWEEGEKKTREKKEVLEVDRDPKQGAEGGGGGGAHALFLCLFSSSFVAASATYDGKNPSFACCTHQTVFLLNSFAIQAWYFDRDISKDWKVFLMGYVHNDASTYDTKFM